MSDDASIPNPRADAIARLEFTPADLARFLAKVDTSGSCWRWTGGQNGSGYGQFHKRASDGRRQRYAHRLAYELWVGPIPEGMTLDHTCERGAEGCITPAHLRVMEMRDNVMLSSRSVLAQKARQTHCIHGHPLSGENLYVTPSGHRACRTCRSSPDMKAWKLEWTRRRRANETPEQREHRQALNREQMRRRYARQKAARSVHRA